MPDHNAVEALLNRLRDWWQARNELASMDQNELRRIAGDLSMTPEELEHLVGRGADGAELLYERMHALGLSRADVESAARGLMFELERTCARCNGKDICDKDLEMRPEDPGWKGYCPNAISLESLIKLRCQHPVGQVALDVARDKH